MTNADRPKAAIVIATPTLSGAENRATKIFRALRREGYPVELWVTQELRDALQDAFPDEARDCYVYRRTGRIQRLQRPLQRHPGLHRLFEKTGIPRALGNPTIEVQMRQRGIAVAHIFLDTQLAHVRGTPTIFELTSPDIADVMGNRPEAWRASHDVYHAVSPSVSRRFRALAPEAEVVDAPGPFFQARKITAKDVPKENTIVFAHRFIPRKNAMLFAEAACRFVVERKDWRVRILGKGEQEGEIRAAIRGHEDRIEVGFDSDLPGALAHSRIFASLIQPDNYPSQSVMEAMLAGNALLLSDTGDSAQMFLDGNGALVDLDPEAVLKAMLDLTRDPIELDRMAERSRVLARQRFSAEGYIEHLTGLYAVTVRGARSRVWHASE